MTVIIKRNHFIESFLLLRKELLHSFDIIVMRVCDLALHDFFHLKLPETIFSGEKKKGNDKMDINVI